ncbi:hypothetical protein KUC_1104 [Vreelandella boliviensis LC1]|uniref:Uncharacterized protein n=1 Tax=Vreelandella boliviensis LC1 TaxID=1072583 RepID=A0A7U9C486_9GAMM|nr:hypothetical protein KUC_1104 [Halomonas boliviensis LC1]
MRGFMLTLYSEKPRILKDKNKQRTALLVSIGASLGDFNGLQCFFSVADDSY